MTDINLTGRPNWVPIECRENGQWGNFSGSFDGNGHTITGMTISSSYGARGMFASVGDREYSGVYNLRLVNVNIRSTGGGAAGLTGQLRQGATISNVHVSGTVTGTSNVGGIVDHAYGAATIVNVSTDVTVTATASLEPNSTNQHGAGGIAGYVGPSVTISNARVSGNVIGNRTAGGVAGYVSSYSTSGGAVLGSIPKIENSYVTGNVTVNGSGSNVLYAGGIVGYAYPATIERNYATGRVAATGSTGAQHVGGIVGRIGGPLATHPGAVQHNVAMNEWVRTSATVATNIGRVVGSFAGSNYSSTNNRAWSGISVTRSTGTTSPVAIITGSGSLTTKDGLSVSNTDMLTQSTWGASGTANTTGSRFVFRSPAPISQYPWIWQYNRMPRLWFEGTGTAWPCEITGTCTPVPFPEHAPPPVIDEAPTMPSVAESDGVFALNIEGSNIVTSAATFTVTAAEGTGASTIVIYNHMGNAVFIRTGVRPGERVVWNLTNTNGRPVPAGSYLAIAASRDKNGRPLRGSVRLGVGR
jgi:hypothetical protein